MSILTGAVCSECYQWHSHMAEDDKIYENGRWRVKYICVNCKEKKMEDKDDNN